MFWHASTLVRVDMHSISTISSLLLQWLMIARSLYVLCMLPSPPMPLVIVAHIGIQVHTSLFLYSWCSCYCRMSVLIRERKRKRKNCTEERKQGKMIVSVCTRGLCILISGKRRAMHCGIAEWQYSYLADSPTRGYFVGRPQLLS
jgi:hypothetical protein